MIYSADDPNLHHFIDDYRTGHYGEDAYPDSLNCDSCGARISNGERYFDVDGRLYCGSCREEAERAVIESVFDDYIYEF